MSQNQNTSQLQVVQTPGALKSYLDKFSGSLEAALPKHLKADRMIRLAMTAFSTTPKLRDCSVQSILSSLVIASQLGLEIGIAGQGYLVPYKTTCTFIPGWQGLVSLLNNTGRATAWTGVLYEGDEYEISLGSEQYVKNIPGVNYGDHDKMKFVYACGKVNGSEVPVIEIWPIAKVWKHRDRYNKVGKQHYSYTQPEMYARKVVLLQVLKYMPKTIELQDAITITNADDSGKLTSRTEEGVIVEIEPHPDDIQQPVIEDKAEGTAGAGATGSKVDKPKEDQKPPHIPDDSLGAELTKLRGTEIAASEVEAWAKKAGLLADDEDLDTITLPGLRRVVEEWEKVRAQILAIRPTV